MNHGVALRLALGLLVVGCSDGRVVLGFNVLDAGASPADAGIAAPSCVAGGPGTASCGANGENCCTSLDVSGGTFYRTFVGSASGPTGEANPAKVSSFRLDKYLVTVGRFRAFMTARNGGAGWTPQAASGKHTHVNGGRGLSATGGGYEPGWVKTDDANVAPTDAKLNCTGSLMPNLAAGSRYATWTPSPGPLESLPITCVNWYEAAAFCIWDGGFLPSEAELEYAAVGGDEQRLYPWASSDPGTASAYAIYGCLYPNGSGQCTGLGNLAPVGTTTLGGGRWGQLDLAGSVWEWTLDWAATFVNPCADCAYLTAGTERSTIGGNFNTQTVWFPPIRHGNNPVDPGAYAYGLRCARAP